MSRLYVGIDNGVTGSIGFVGSSAKYLRIPTRKEQNYTTAKAQITRIEVDLLMDIFRENRAEDMRVFIERPFVNPRGIKATISAVRALEATLVVMEMMGISYQYIDSRKWQKSLLPSGCKGKELKDASRDIGIRLFPELEDVIRKQKDADGILIAEWARREKL